MSKAEQKKYPKFLFKLEDVEFPERFNSRQFGPYEHPKTGKLVYLINPDGKAIESGLIIGQMNILYDVQHIVNAERVRFLIDHPENIKNGGEAFSLTNVEEESENKDLDLIQELELEQKVMTLDLRKLKAASATLGLNYNLPKQNLKAQLVRRIRTPQQLAGSSKTEPGYISVERIINAKKTLILLDITQMLEYDIISINNSGIYIHGNHNLGLNPEQVVVYFEKEKALYGLLKTELRAKLKADGKLDDGKDNLELKLE